MNTTRVQSSESRGTEGGKGDMTVKSFSLKQFQEKAKSINWGHSKGCNCLRCRNH